MVDAGTCLFIAIALPLLVSPLVAWAGRVLGQKTGYLALVFPALSTLSILLLGFQAGSPPEAVYQWNWIPFLGIQLSFLVDGLSLFFGLVVSGAGTLIFFYSSQYLDDHYKHHGRFYCFLLLFMAAMLGTVFSNNFMLLFVFWELTGLASFLLIGFLHEKESSRIGARQALLVTGLTGLLMLVGVIMTGASAGTLELNAIFEQGLPVEEQKGWLTAAMILILLGAFGKSAQFPFHFWLPNAMAAPTPVSAYLHSATMVKLGVFLCARIFPAFAELELWGPLVTFIGFFTMVLGGILMLLAFDLKAMLAFSTVSQLGFLIGIYGLGAGTGVRFDFLHILNHVFYKGCLFMVAGIIDHSTGRRDIRRLGGLWQQMPLLGVITLISVAAMAGFPLTTGFLSKEEILAAVLGLTEAPGMAAWLVLGSVVVVAVLKVIFALRFFTRIFLGPASPGLLEHLHKPGLALMLSPLALAFLALLFGSFPSLLQWMLEGLTVKGLHAATTEKLVLWHGITPALVISIIIFLAGIGFWNVGEKRDWFVYEPPFWLRFGEYFELGVERFSKFTKTLTGWLRADSPIDYLPVILGFTLALVGGYLGFQYLGRIGQLPELLRIWGEEFSLIRAFTAGLISLAVIGVVVLKRWTTQLISLSVAGFLIAFYFVLYQAPDLALTQVLIEAVTLMLILLLLARFPKSAEQGELTRKSGGARRVYNMIVAVGMGGMVTAFVLLVLAEPHPEPIGRLFLAHTVELAAGSNAVNTILVDFRGLDTLGEITVLLIAMLGGLGLLMRYKRTAQEYKRGPMGAPGFGVHQKEKE
jgi:NADH:ubiquinone oxidoreductase subunit 5 (subunit L)/multisubunit Na+/H+ antiporter MnhA subunit